ncbi:hypothetical protein AC578_7986 [Pseudocercospora eumusae]|uniref:Uncharacterized protein n=1 Tax=Pseudocercospora eumusae TaxID=321146 RepID=A0A139H0E9_9PEZI|nr:hypothetical protein AC578_7986 [Pseudocercospora eumusae]
MFLKSCVDCVANAYQVSPTLMMDGSGNYKQSLKSSRLSSGAHSAKPPNNHAVNPTRIQVITIFAKRGTMFPAAAKNHNCTPTQIKEIGNE